MLKVNDSAYENNSYSLFGPMGMAFYDDGNLLDETLSVKIILSVYLAVTMLLNLIGNVCTCAVIIQNRSMRTPTNCYLFNIAIIDLLTGLFVPIEIYLIWIPEFYPFGEFGCLVHLILWDFLLNASLLIITAFTLERYLVVTRPFLRQKLALNSRVYKIVWVIWFVCALFIIPDLFYIDLLEKKKYVLCYFSISAGNNAIVGFEVFAFSVVPMVLITVLYILIFIELNSEKRKPRASPVIVQHNRDKAIKMLAAISATFFVFFSPYCILRVMIIFPELNYKNNYQTWKIMNYLCYMGYMSTVANPILYSLMSRKFRQAFKDYLQNLASFRSPLLWAMSTTTTFSMLNLAPIFTLTFLDLLKRKPAIRQGSNTEIPISISITSGNKKFHSKLKLHIP